MGIATDVVAVVVVVAAISCNIPRSVRRQFITGLTRRITSHYWLIRFIFQDVHRRVLRDLFAYGERFSSLPSVDRYTRYTIRRYTIVCVSRWAGGSGFFFRLFKTKCKSKPNRINSTRYEFTPETQDDSYARNRFQYWQIP